jgi:hypothetical protein
MPRNRVISEGLEETMTMLSSHVIVHFHRWRGSRKSIVEQEIVLE